MRKITIRAVGRLPEPWTREAEESYLKRLKPFAKLEIIEVAEGQKGSSKPDPERVKASEADALLKGIDANDVVIALDEHGKEFSSVAFAAKLETWNRGEKLIFVIGGSWGLHASIRNRANLTLSLGAMTYPHALGRIVLLEQLYRAMTIASGKEYHK
jgi:23S rRNA (pseudouridine1915-N3)-methyltransferase